MGLVGLSRFPNLSIGSKILIYFFIEVPESVSCGLTASIHNAVQLELSYTQKLKRARWFCFISWYFPKMEKGYQRTRYGCHYVRIVIFQGNIVIIKELCGDIVFSTYKFIPKVSFNKVAIIDTEHLQEQMLDELHSWHMIYWRDQDMQLKSLEACRMNVSTGTLNHLYRERYLTILIRLMEWKCRNVTIL